MLKNFAIDPKPSRRRFLQGLRIRDADLDVPVALHDQDRLLHPSGKVCGVQRKRADKKALDSRRKQWRQRGRHGVCIDALARRQCIDRGIGLRQQRRIGRLGTKLRLHHVAHGAASRCNEDESADVRAFLGGRQGDESAFAMSEQPDAFRFAPESDVVHPGPGVADIVFDRDGIGVADGTGAGPDAALVDADRRDSLLPQTLGQKTVGAGFDSERAVAIPVRGTGAGDDQDDRRACVGRPDPGSSKIALRPVYGDVFRRHRGCRQRQH